MDEKKEAPLKTWDLTPQPSPTAKPGDEGVPPPPAEKPMKVLDPKALGDLAWELINQAVQTKRIKVPSTGKAVDVQDSDYLKTLQWAAGQKIKGKRGLVQKPEDFNLKETK